MGGEEINLFFFGTFDLKEDGRKNYAKLVNEFEEYASSKTNVVMERFKLNMICQLPGEPFDNFQRDLKKLVKSCDFVDHQGSLLKKFETLKFNIM